jgi:hypothetical protein
VKKKIRKPAQTKARANRVRSEAKEPKSQRVECPDCNREYNVTAPHDMFCPAKTCSTCHKTFGRVLTVTGEDDDGNEERKCEECILHEDDDNEEEEEE